MKTIYILIAFLILSSCQNPDEFLDVVPTGTIIPSTLEDYDKMLQDYAILRSVGTNNRYIDPDVYHSQASFSTISNNSVSVNAYMWKHDIFNATQSDADYNSYYYYIHVMNQILQDIDNASPGNFNPVNRNNLKAEALAQRAMEYFLTVNEYAHHYDPAKPNQSGVAMPLSIDIQALLSKSTVSDVYKQIIKDLDEALSLFSVNYPAINEYANFRPGKASVYALLAEVYLYMGDFEKSKTYSNNALAMYNYLYDYKTINFSNPSSPWLGYTAPASVDWSYGTLNKEIIWHRYIDWSFSSPFHLYSTDLEALYDKTNDRRWYLFATQKSKTGISVAPNNIYIYANSERCNGLSVPRLILTNAEAKVRTNDGNGAITVLNTLLAKRIVNFVPLTHSDNAKTLKLIKDERRKELAGTSLNIFDQKRYHVYKETVPTYTRTNPNTNETVTLVPGGDGYVVKIAPSVRNLNPNLN